MSPVASAPDVSSLLEGRPSSNSAPSWLSSLRVAGEDRFRITGLPTRKQESWRFTDVSTLARAAFSPAESSGDAGKLPVFHDKHLLGSTAIQVNCVNGCVVPLASPIAGAGLSVGSLAQAVMNESTLPALLGSVVKLQDHTFAALNAAWLLDGLYVRVGRGHKVAESLLLNVVSTATSGHVMSHPRHVIHLEEGAELTLVEDCRSTGSANHFVNSVMEIVLERGARLNHFKIQREEVSTTHIGNTGVRQASGSYYSSTLIVLGGALVRNDIETRLEGNHAECELLGLYLASGDTLVDTHTLMNHVAPDCKSREIYHGILSGHAHGVFNGRVIVQPNAQHSDSAQSARTLMLSDTAIIDAKPQLEILADDVKCSHGATVGRLSEESLHYLRARGISASDAKRMLTMAFARQILDGVQQEALRATLEELIEGMLTR